MSNVELTREAWRVMQAEGVESTVLDELFSDSERKSSNPGETEPKAEDA